MSDMESVYNRSNTGMRILRLRDILAVVDDSQAQQAIVNRILELDAIDLAYIDRMCIPRMDT
jgi:hypothetical protein